MNFRIISLIVLTSALCNAQALRRTSRCEPFIYERLRSYFEINELRPMQVINNDLDLGRAESRIQKISVGDQNLEWIDEVHAESWKVSVRINGELIPLWDKETINTPDENMKLQLSVADQWRQIKLFRIGDQTMLGISMSSRSCTGLMCSVGAQLWYDLKSKRRTFFGSYRSDSDVRLFQSREKIYTVTTNFQGDPHRVTNPAVMRYEMYGLDSDGRFQLEKDRRGVPYFIKHTQFINGELGRAATTRKKRLQFDSLEQHWIENVMVYVQ